MGLGIVAVHHVQVTVPKAIEGAAKHFYGTLLGLEEIAKPADTLGRGGAWYKGGAIEIHLSLEEQTASGEQSTSKRHICYQVADLTVAERMLREAGVEILADSQPIKNWSRFLIRDPGGNRLEIAQAV